MSKDEVPLAGKISLGLLLAILVIMIYNIS